MGDEFYAIIKLVSGEEIFSLIVVDNENENDFKSSIPKYLFKQRSFMINLFNKFNNKKKTLLLNLLHKTERYATKPAEPRPPEKFSPATVKIR